jgi:formate--tetrahydrofolate ligase
MALLLKDALLPNLVQTLEGGPALVHGGPFANIAHGCNTVMATTLALALADIVVTEAGFGADLGAEKFFDIKSRFAGLKPEVCVIVATVRALKMHGGADKKQLGTPNPAQVETGFANLQQHVENVRKFGVPPIVALNRFSSDTDEELQVVLAKAKTLGVPVALSEVWAKGGEGGLAVAEAVLGALAGGKAAFRPLYDTGRPIREKIETIAREMYRADGVTYLPAAEKSIQQLEGMGMGQTPVCMAKTQYSFTDDATKLNAPRGHRITIREVYPSAGAGFVVALAGDIMTMPGLSKSPAAERIRMHEDGTIEGLF